MDRQGPSLNTTASRRHDLDALRAFAMLLGIFYHAALSLALGFPWFIQDSAANRSLYIFQSAVHGFRMPLFFIVSGFFTAMLWNSKGLKALVWHRFRRVLLPCMVGLMTVVPFSNWVIGYAMRSAEVQRTSKPALQAPEDSIWAAIRKFDSERVQVFLSDGFPTDRMHPEYRISALTWATLVGDTASAQVLLNAGCDPDLRNQDSNTPLHAAAFFGRSDIASLLIERGADINARNNEGETPLSNARGDLAFAPMEFVQLLSGCRRNT